MRESSSTVMLYSEVGCFVTWTKEMTLTLIDLYKSYDCLWYRGHIHYRHRQVKMKAINAISAELGLHAEEVMRKLHNLRCQLNSEIRKVVKKRKEGVCYNSAWDLFDKLLFMSEVQLPEQPAEVAVPTVNVKRKNHTDPRMFLKQKLPPQNQLNYRLSTVKGKVLDDLIEVKYEIEDSQALYPFVQIDTEMSQDPLEPQVATLYAATGIQSAPSDLPANVKVEKTPDDAMVTFAENIAARTPDVLPMTSDVFVDNPMTDDGEDDARSFGAFVTAEMSRIRSEDRRKSLKKTIAEAIKVMVEEDEKEFFQDPDTDPLC